MIPRFDYKSLSGRSCVTCDYLLAGLDPASKCPECGTPIAASLRATPFPGMSKRDASLLARGCGALLWAFFTPFIVMIAWLLLAIFLDMFGGRDTVQWAAIVSGIAGFGVPVLLWLLGWICLSRVRTRGAGKGSDAARVSASVLTYASGGAILLAPAIVSLGAEHIVMAWAGVVVTCSCLQILVAQWRLTTLCDAARDRELAAGGRDLLRLLLVILVGLAGAIVAALIEIGVAAFLGMLLVPLALAAAVGWLAFLSAVRTAARETMKGTAE